MIPASGVPLTALVLLQTVGGYPRSIILGLLALLVLPVVTILFVSHLVDIETIDEQRLSQVEEAVAELRKEVEKEIDADASASAAGVGGSGSTGSASAGDPAGSGPVDRETPIEESGADGSPVGDRATDESPVGDHVAGGPSGAPDGGHEAGEDADEGNDPDGDATDA